MKWGSREVERGKEEEGREDEDAEEEYLSIHLIF